VIPGEEYQLLRDYYVKSCYNFQVRDLTPARDPAVCGEALLHTDTDIETVGRVLVEDFEKQLKAGEAVAFIGHGNPLEDYAHANVPYAKIETFMKKYALEKYGNGNIFVGTVDDPTMLLDYVVEGLTKANFDKTKTVNITTLMSIAGDHANNDMADENDPESWVSTIKAAGWPKVNPIRKGLGDYPAINEVWIRHLREAIANPGGGH
jgi:sirohydrochlorin cobaltochelatase